MRVSLRREFAFREARIGYDRGRGPTRTLPLKLDAYLPDHPIRSPTPALVLAHGGAFYRGSKEADSFSSGVGTSTSIAEYCRRFADLGLAAFSVEYRLAQTDPEPSHDPVLTRPEEVPMSRVRSLRAELGLPPITPQEMARAMEAAFEDLAEALSGFLKGRIDSHEVYRSIVCP